MNVNLYNFLINLVSLSGLSLSLPLLIRTKTLNLKPDLHTKSEKIF